MRSRNVIAATSPWRFEDSYTEIYLKVWFEELSEPVQFVATLFDAERHGIELWVRAMAGEYGPIDVVTMPRQMPQLQPPLRMIAHDR